METRKMIEKCENAWDQLQPHEKAIFLRWLVEAWKTLESGMPCERIDTCPKSNRLESEWETLVNIQKIIERKDCQPCRTCLIAKELLPTVEFAESFEPTWQNFCPCYMYGRDNAMSRLKSAIDRISDELSM